jgi:hypothetical protein
MTIAGSIIVNTEGWACVSLDAMHALNIELEDLFEFGIDLDENPAYMRSLFFFKVQSINPLIEEKSMLLKFRRHKRKARGFYIAPLLKLMNVKPPFVCEFKAGREYGSHFSLVFPVFKSFKLSGDLISKLVEYKPYKHVSGI